MRIQQGMPHSTLHYISGDVYPMKKGFSFFDTERSKGLKTYIIIPVTQCTKFPLKTCCNFVYLLVACQVSDELDRW